MSEIFNSKGTAHKTGDYPLFGGESPSLYDGVNMKYPFFYDQKERLRQLDWAVDDVDLTQTRMDLVRCDKNLRNIMLYNLAYQWSLDSIATSIPALLSPFITNWEYGHVIARIGENEMLHSDTYSSIVLQCVPDPQEVFDMVYTHQQVLDRSSVVDKALSELRDVGCEYTLGMKTFEECMPYLLKGLIAIYTLERGSFMNSFACTFGLAEQEYFIGAARLVQKILTDETIHFEVQRSALKDVLLKQGHWKAVAAVHQEEIQAIVDGVLEQELGWNKYIFSQGRSMVGLNEAVLNEWTRYNMQEIYQNLGLDAPFRKVNKNPLPWFDENWVNLNAQQNANMEASATNYMVSSVDRTEDINDEDFDFNFD